MEENEEEASDDTNNDKDHEPEQKEAEGRPDEGRHNPTNQCEEANNEQHKADMAKNQSIDEMGESAKGMLGLQNLGNTCFMNAALQCLAHTHGLQKYFRTCSHAYNTKGQNSRQKLLMAFAHWFKRDWEKSTSANYHAPEDILRSVQQLNPTFTGYSQQDSQEFLRCVLDNMHEELRRNVRH